MHLNARLTYRLRYNDSHKPFSGYLYAEPRACPPHLILEMQFIIPRAPAATFIRQSLVDLKADMGCCSILASATIETCRLLPRLAWTFISLRSLVSMPLSL